MADDQLPEEFQWVKDGEPVWYQPSQLSPQRHAATVDGRPWLINGSDGTWVVHLIDVDPAYRNGRGTVKAAYLGALEPRKTSIEFRFDDGPYEGVLKTFRPGSHGGIRNTSAQDIVAALVAARRDVRHGILRAVAAECLDDPEFGVESQDSQALLELRRAIDEVDIWPNERAKEGGDYDHAIRHMAYLAKCFQGVKEALEAILEPDLP